MTSQQKMIAGLAALVVAGAGACGTRDDAPPPPAAVAAPPPMSAEEWRAKHDADYRRDWVTIAGLHALKPGPNTAGSAASHDIVLPAAVPASIGTFVLDGGKVRFQPAPGGGARIKDQPVVAPVELRDDTQPEPDEIVLGSVRLVVHPSGTTPMLRVRDPDGPLAKGFLGFSWFDIDPQYRVTGRFIKDSEAESLRILNTFGDLDEYKTEGVVEFTLLGQTLRLRPFTTRPNRFYFVFRDASSGVETYETARFLYSDLLPDGTTVLDFNIAYNPPCAFNPYTTCPIPLPENRLPIKILAGEKAYPVPVAIPETPARATGAARPGQ
jgi:uncharacterized protein (DUF1684 family)